MFWDTAGGEGWGKIQAFEGHHRGGNEEHRAVSAYQAIPKIWAKLEEIKKETGTTWALFVAEELLKSRATLQPVDKTIENTAAVAPDNDPENLDKDREPSLYGSTLEA